MELADLEFDYTLPLISSGSGYPKKVRELCRHPKLALCHFPIRVIAARTYLISSDNVVVALRSGFKEGGFGVTTPDFNKVVFGFVCCEVMWTCPAYRKDSGEEKVLTCDEEIRSMYLDGKFIGKVPEYDLLHILQNYGGAPGMLDLREADKTRGKHTKDDPANQTLVYDYRRSDYTTYVRIEKGFRLPGESANKSLEISGELFWYPKNFCGWMRRASYNFSENGFSPNIHYGTKCELDILFPGHSSEKMLSCVPVGNCTTHHNCVTGVFVMPLESILRSN